MDGVMLSKPQKKGSAYFLSLFVVIYISNIRIDFNLKKVMVRITPCKAKVIHRLIV